MDIEYQEEFKDNDEEYKKGLDSNPNEINENIHQKYTIRIHSK